MNIFKIRNEIQGLEAERGLSLEGSFRPFLSSAVSGMMFLIRQTVGEGYICQSAHPSVAPSSEPRPRCAANQPVVLTHFLASSVMLKVPETDSFSTNPIYFSQAVMSSLQTYLHCSLEAERAHLNISLWHHHTLNMPQDMVYTGQDRCSHTSVREYYCRRLGSVTWHVNISLCDE